MQTELFRATVRMVAAAAVIDLDGEINRAADGPLNAAVDAATAMNPAAVLLDFSGVGYINSTGIAVIVGILAKARRDGVTMTAYGLSEHYRTIFEITRLVDFIGIYPDEYSALRNDVMAGDHDRDLPTHESRSG
jgi:anti-sigma B factor antagonist